MQDLLQSMDYVPRTCVWELTRACNLSCSHCGSAAGRPRSLELTTDEALETVEQLAALGTRLITLSGGEPTLREDWPLIAKTAVDAGVIVNLVTNGQTDARRLAKNALDTGLANVAVSLDGLAETHDELRRTGAFEKATTSIRTFAEQGVWVDVMMTINRRNIDEVRAVYELCDQLGARGFRAQLGKPMGNQTCRDDLTLGPQQLLTLIPLLGDLARSPSGPRLNVGDSIGYFSGDEKTLRGHRCEQGHWTGCWAGCQAIGIQADGSIKGCLSLQPRAGEEDPFIEGNLRQSTLEEIWRRPGAFAYNRDFSLDDLTGTCASCSYAEVCRGGAKCVAHAYTGSFGSDPMCFHRETLAGFGQWRRAWAQAATAVTASVVLALGAAGCAEEDPVDCEEIECSDGADAVGLHEFRECCCEGVCCECDYGFPPPECCW